MDVKDVKGRAKGKGFPPARVVERALWESGGFLSAAAELLGCAQSTLSERVKKNDRLAACLKLIEESFLDLSEHKLVRAIKNNEAWAIQFYLRTKGKGRGYVEGGKGEQREETAPIFIHQPSGGALPVVKTYSTQSNDAVNGK